MLVIHELMMHPGELDRVLHMESNYAGTSWLTLDKLGTQLGSPLVNLYSSGTGYDDFGVSPYDDEGVEVPAEVPLVTNGQFVGYLTNRQTAAVIGQRSTGNGRCESPGFPKLVRGRKVCMKPGDQPLSLEQLIAQTENGILVRNNRCWSINADRTGYLFGPEKAQRIKNGRLGETYKNVAFSGSSPAIWQSVDAVCDQSEYVTTGLKTCSKGQGPDQAVDMTHGCAPFRIEADVNRPTNTWTKYAGCHSKAAAPRDIAGALDYASPQEVLPLLTQLRGGGGRHDH